MLAKCQMLCYSIQVGKRKMLSIRKYGRLVKGLRRRPLTAETGVRFPYLLLKTQEQIVPEFFCVLCSRSACIFILSMLYLRPLKAHKNKVLQGYRRFPA